MDVKFPIGPLEVPDVITMQHVEEWLDDISTYADRLEAVIKPLSKEAFKKTYRDGSWDVLQLVHHIADSQLVMYQRLKLALTDDNPVVPPFIQDSWALLADNHLSYESSIDMLRGMNERIVYLANHLTNDDLLKTFTLRGTGEITVGIKLAKLRWHEEHHLEHIKIALSS
ncbi:MAG TPA: putative metal-dependent hydrolase [Bacillota bacterium]|nr:putative metal-dependent hydrolase [Bacillota bacterium]